MGRYPTNAGQQMLSLTNRAGATALGMLGGGATLAATALPRLAWGYQNGFSNQSYRSEPLLLPDIKQLVTYWTCFTILGGLTMIFSAMANARANTLLRHCQATPQASLLAKETKRLSRLPLWITVGIGVGTLATMLATPAIGTTHSATVFHGALGIQGATTLGSLWQVIRLRALIRETQPAPTATQNSSPSQPGTTSSRRGQGLPVGKSSGHLTRIK